MSLHHAQNSAQCAQQKCPPIPILRAFLMKHARSGQWAASSLSHLCCLPWKEKFHLWFQIVYLLDICELETVNSCHHSLICFICAPMQREGRTKCRKYHEAHPQFNLFHGHAHDVPLSSRCHRDLPATNSSGCVTTWSASSLLSPISMYLPLSKLWCFKLLHHHSPQFWFITDFSFKNRRFPQQLAPDMHIL